MTWYQRLGCLLHVYFTAILQCEVEKTDLDNGFNTMPKSAAWILPMPLIWCIVQGSGSEPCSNSLSNYESQLVSMWPLKCSLAASVDITGNVLLPRCFQVLFVHSHFVLCLVDFKLFCQAENIYDTQIV